jgi:hypothetical protein
LRFAPQVFPSVTAAAAVSMDYAGVAHTLEPLLDGILLREANKLTMSASFSESFVQPFRCDPGAGELPWKTDVEAAPGCKKVPQLGLGANKIRPIR